MAIDLAVGFILGTMLSAAALPQGLDAINASQWALVFAGIFFGIWRIVVGSRSAGKTHRLQSGEEQDAAIAIGGSGKEVEARVKKSLVVLREEADAYSRDRQRSLSDPRRREQGKSVGGVEAHQMIEQIRVELLSEYQLYRSGEATLTDLQAAREKAIKDRKSVRKQFGLPATDDIRQLERELRGEPG